ncbi:hypothetical protein [Lignipirellula cremea]|uniref:Uncharacterized protein n=1 Tax=Lignipirellula cremea TaxID=2528010 RepID=A0A518DPX6_9BACT|nr:hypothetical protein [Lignipirellula cremea]QDU93892.1 hypothetical protein Pla8534_16770 [Lignipirellula cremea]
MAKSEQRRQKDRVKRKRKHDRRNLVARSQERDPSADAIAVLQGLKRSFGEHSEQILRLCLADCTPEEIAAQTPNVSVADVKRFHADFLEFPPTLVGYFVDHPFLLSHPQLLRTAIQQLKTKKSTGF